LTTEEVRAIGKFGSIMNFYLGALTDRPDVTPVVYNEASIHGVEELAEVTSHDFWLRNGKTDRMASLGEREGESPITLRRRIGWSEKTQV